MGGCSGLHMPAQPPSPKPGYGPEFLMGLMKAVLAVNEPGVNDNACVKSTAAFESCVL